MNTQATLGMIGMIGFSGGELLFLTLALALTAFWIGMLVECARRILHGDTNQVGWLIVLALTHGFGALAYFFVGRRSARVAQP